MATPNSDPVVSTSQFSTVPNGSGVSVGAPLYPPEGPNPTGTTPESAAQIADETPTNPVEGAGVEGEEVTWEARYSMKNFVGRITTRIVLTGAWVALAVYTWGFHHGDWAVLTSLFGAVLLILWLALLYRIMQARYGHEYRLTTRRLFVSTGLLRRRHDMMELLRVKDVFTRETWFERLFALGTVVVVPNDHDLPTFYLTGVDDPKRVMDLVWHYARSERDRRSMKVEQV